MDWSPVIGHIDGSQVICLFRFIREPITWSRSSVPAALAAYYAYLIVGIARSFSHEHEFEMHSRVEEDRPQRGDDF